MSGEQRYRASAVVPGVASITEHSLDTITTRIGGTVSHDAEYGVLHLVWRFGAASMVKAAHEAATVAQECVLLLGCEASMITVRKVRSGESVPL